MASFLPKLEQPSLPFKSRQTLVNTESVDFPSKSLGRSCLPGHQHQEQQGVKLLWWVLVSGFICLYESLLRALRMLGVSGKQSQELSKVPRILAGLMEWVEALRNRGSQ
jgi:hypothetical protein